MLVKVVSGEAGRVFAWPGNGRQSGRREVEQRPPPGALCVAEHPIDRDGDALLAFCVAEDGGGASVGLVDGGGGPQVRGGGGPPVLGRPVPRRSVAVDLV